MRVFYLVSIWLHLLAAVTWIGGMAFFVVILMPVVRRHLATEAQRDLLYRVGLRVVGWWMLGVLVVTGGVNLAVRGVGWSALTHVALWSGPWGRALLAKLVLVGLTLLLSALHDFWIGPKALDLARIDPLGPSTRRYTLAARWMGRGLFLLALGILFLAGTLPRGGL